MNTNMLQDRIRGSLIGGAIGDALGYPVEFMSLREIKEKYGESGITRYDVSRDGIAHFSDDTQMTLFTANGYLNGETRFCMRGIGGDPGKITGRFFDPLKMADVIIMNEIKTL